MKIQSTLLLLAVLLFAQAARAQDDFRVIIAKGDGEPKLSGEQIAQFKKAGVASPDELPIVVCPLGGQNKTQTDPSNTFQVVIENTQGKEVKITMNAEGWYNCLAFKLVDDAGKSYVITRPMVIAPYSKNVQARIWGPNGKQIFPASFLDPMWYAYAKAKKGVRGDAAVGWPAPKQPVIGHLTATFRYDFDGKPMEVSSKTADVILMAK